MIDVDVRADMNGAKVLLGALEREKDAAAVRGLNRAANGARKDAVIQLKPLYPGLQVKAIRGRIKVSKATRGSLVSSARFAGTRIPIYGNFNMRAKGKFGVRFGKLPYRVETLEGQVVSGQMLERAFRNRLVSGRATVLARVGDQRYPITVLLAPALSKAVVEKAIKESLKKSGHERFVKEFTQAVKILKERRLAG